MFYNDIWISGSADAVKAADTFFNSVSITHSNKDEAIEALSKLVLVLRKDLGVSNKEIGSLEYKIYTPNLEDLKKKKPE